jgi:hypothetical protein
LPLSPRFYVKQTEHSSISIFGSVLWQNWHIRPFLRIVMHVWQKRLSNSARLGSPSMSRFIMLFIRGCISSMSSIFITCPLTCRVYLLTADCDIPRASATSFCFRLYFSTSSFAIAALIAGMTDFTAISQGIIK